VVCPKHVRPKTDAARYVDEPEFGYQYIDRLRKSGRKITRNVKTYLWNEFSWELRGYCLTNYLLMDIGVVLDAKFTMAQKLTYYT